MIPFPKIEPVMIKIGPLSVRWYGVMYLLGFAASYILVKYQIKKKKLAINTDDIDSLYSFLIAGLILGARLGYVLFYNFSEYLKNPAEIFAVWHGGMSFHGGLIGAVVAGVIFSVKKKYDVWVLADLVMVTAPIGLGLGRLGNFINGELYGRVTDVPWGMVFPAGGPLPRHPSQLYEFLLEGVTLFALLWFVKDKNYKAGTITSLFLILYGVFRVIAEFFREPDPQIGFILGAFTMGQMLSAVMISVGVGILLFKNRRTTLKTP
ncbi:MAG: prolipoprotein diacylglyceryl transferase [Nitrospirota bacterium]